MKNDWQKSFSLDAWRELVRSAWDKLADDIPSTYVWVDEVFDDHIIVCKERVYWHVPYTKDGERVVFAPMNEWFIVTRETSWLPEAGVTPDVTYVWVDEQPIAVKMLDDSRVYGLAIRFGDKTQTDLSSQRDFFTAGTDLWLDSLGFTAGKACAPMIYHHAAEVATADAPVIGTWTKAVVDEVGVWLEGQLDLSHKYVSAVKTLIRRGLLMISADSAPHLLQREEQDNGAHKMLRWPLLAASLTVSPMEPRLLPVAMLGEAYKAVGNSDFIKHLEVMNMDPELVEQIATAVAAKMATPAVIEAPTPEAAAKALDNPYGGLYGSEFRAAVLKDVMDHLSEQPAIKAAGFLNLLPKSQGPFFNKLPHGMDNVKAFNLMLHYGEHRLSDAVKSLLVFDDGSRGREVPDGVKAALNVTTAGQGGYLVPVEYSMEFIKSLAEQSYLRQAKASQMMFPEALTFKIPGLTYGAAAALTAEAAAFDQVEPTTTEITFQAYKYTRLSKASDELVDDSRFDLWTQVLSPDWVQAFAAAENTAFTTGTGSSQPQGVVTGAGTGKTTASATAITADEIIDLFFSLNHLYREHPSAAFMMNDSIFQYVAKLKDGNGRYLVNQDLARGFPPTLLGKPIVLNNSMASTVATGNKTILFGAFDYFKIADRSSKQDGKLAGTEIYVRRLNELYAASGQVGFRAFCRFDSHVMLAAAFKLLVQA